MYVLLIFLFSPTLHFLLVFVWFCTDLCVIVTFVVPLSLLGIVGAPFEALWGSLAPLPHSGSGALGPL